MKEKIIFGILGGIGVLNGIILHNIINVQKEIEYFENAKNITWNRKEYEKLINTEFKVESK